MISKKPSTQGIKCCVNRQGHSFIARRIIYSKETGDCDSIEGNRAGLMQS